MQPFVRSKHAAEQEGKRIHRNLFFKQNESVPFTVCCWHLYVISSRSWLTDLPLI